MFVRRKPNKTGTVSVQVIAKKRRLNKVIQSFGVGRTEIEIVRLEEMARQFIREHQGLTNELFANEDELKIESFISSLFLFWCPFFGRFEQEVTATCEKLFF